MEILNKPSEDTKLPDGDALFQADCYLDLHKEEILRR